MQKSLSLILANTRKSEAYFDDLKKNNLPIEKIIFYSKIKNSKFLKKLDIYPYKNSIKFVKTNLVNSKIVEKEIELKKLNSKKSNIQLRKKLKKKRLEILKLSQ